MASYPIVHLTTVGGSFHGRVLVARLGAEGIQAELRGGVEGPYPNIGSVEVFVKASQVELARQVLLADAVDAAFDEPSALADTDLDDLEADSELGTVGDEPGAEAEPAGPEWAGRHRWIRPAFAVLALLVVLALLAGVRGV